MATSCKPLVQRSRPRINTTEEHPVAAQKSTPTVTTASSAHGSVSLKQVLAIVYCISRADESRPDGHIKDRKRRIE
jgi:hypothetical protein